jgi:hypothetical protein
VKLPFLEKKGWPKLGKLAGTSRYGYSEDDDLIEHSLDELMDAHARKDHKGFMSAMNALIDFILNKEGSDAHSDEAS